MHFAHQWVLVFVWMCESETMMDERTAQTHFITIFVLFRQRESTPRLMWEEESQWLMRWLLYFHLCRGAGGLGWVLCLQYSFEHYYTQCVGYFEILLAGQFLISVIQNVLDERELFCVGKMIQTNDFIVLALDLICVSTFIPYLP